MYYRRLFWISLVCLTLLLATWPQATASVLVATQDVAVTAAQVATPTTATINKARANLRSGPGTSFPVVGTAKLGDTFVIVGRNQASDWFEIVQEGKPNAWVSRIVVTVSSPIDTIPLSAASSQPPKPVPPGTPAPAQPTAAQAASPVAGDKPTATISKASANLRGGPGTGFPVVGTAKLGDTFVIVGRNQAGDWFEIVQEGKPNAWVSKVVARVSSPIDAIPLSAESSQLPAPAAAAPASPAQPAAAQPPAPPAAVQPVAAAPAAGGPTRGRLLYSVANMDANRWELWEYNFANGASSKVADWRTEVDVSKDGSQIAYFAWQGEVGVWIMDSNFSNERLLIGGGAYPSFNPGGDRLVLNGGEDIYLINSDGGGLRKLTRGEYPSWSPVSDEIIHRACVGGGCGLYVIDANSADANAKRRLTEGGGDGQPAWSPNGSRIAYISKDDGNFEIYVINADGTGKSRVTNDPASDGLPVWSPDGQWLAFRSDRGGSWAIYAVRPDGTGLRKLIDANVLDHWFFEKDWR